MQAYIVRRLLSAVPILLGVSFVAFIMLYLMPGDPVTVLVSSFEAAVSGDQIEQIRDNYGLNDSLPVQYVDFLWNALQGDLGESILKGRPVTELILEAFPSTFELAVAAAIISLVMGAFLGVISAINHRTWLDGAASFVALVAVSMPEFWFGMLAILFLSVQLGIFPSSGSGGLMYLILPAFVLGTRAAAAIARVTRSAMLEAMNQQYVVTAEAKGLSYFMVVWHAFRNALMPVVTVFGLEIGRLLGGTVVVETIFNRQGIGKLLIDAILQKDVPVLRGTLLFIAVMYVAINIIVDISYAWINPKVKYS